MKTKNYITKVRSQFKSSYYYLFWGAATIAVVAGQIYVGSGYRVLSNGVEDLIEVISTPRPKASPADIYSMPIIK
tara:strand:- start:74 stop:298 length:225 start_codon:yes stop_codon:yes gene_type:complete